MDKPHWPQELVVKPMEEILAPNTTNSSNNNNINNNFSKPSSSSSSFERRTRPQKAASVNCPRCNSTNTKFCYYNNYSLSQPRYFCKSCRRYWTEGGTLRNIPVGGGSRKNKRSSSSSITSSCSTSSSYLKTLPDLVVPSTSPLVLSQNPRIIHHDQYGQDLNLGFPSTNNFKNVSQIFQAPNFDATRVSNSSALELLNGITTRGITNSFIPVPNPNSVYTPSTQLVIPLPEFKIPALGFTLDGMGSGDHGGRLLFPFQELRSNTSTPHHDHDGQNKDQNYDSNGLWNGMMGGGSW